MRELWSQFCPIQILHLDSKSVNNMASETLDLKGNPGVYARPLKAETVPSAGQASRQGQAGLYQAPPQRNSKANYQHSSQTASKAQEAAANSQRCSDMGQLQNHKTRASDQVDLAEKVKQC